MRLPSWLTTWPAIPASVYAVAIVVLTGGAYVNSLQAPFVLDDLTTIAANPTIRSLSPLRDVLFPPGEIYSAGRPVLNLSFALNYAIGGHVVGGYHVINLVIHLAAALVLFGVVRRTLELPRGAEFFRAYAAPLAFAVAALWAVHPLLTSAVTYVSQRAESLMGLFYLITLYAFVRGAERVSALWMGTGVAACALGMATKEVMVSAPMVVLLFDRVFVAASWREVWERRRLWHLAHAATWVLLFALIAGARLGQRGVGFDHGLTWFRYLCLESHAITLYLLRCIWPVDLVFDYGANLPLPGVPALVGQFTLLGALFAISVRALWRGTAAGFLGAAFFILLAPTSSVVPLAGQPIAESRMYLPLATVVAALIGGATRRAPRLTAAIVPAALALLAMLTTQRNGLLSDANALWADTVAKRPMNERAVVEWSESLKRTGRPGEAAEVLRAMHRRRPESAEICNNLAVALLGIGDTGEAVRLLREAVRLKPGYAAAFSNLGHALHRTGDFAGALENFMHAVRLGYETTDVRNLAGLCLVQLQRHAEAVPHFERALQLDPRNAEARANLERTRALVRQ
ncbi:MAG: tetratricopeptide repeat protein [Opitutaceae bacterium]|nr:tetratricopeptide repeat protein [Opitutaceae bacterium]